MLTVEVKINGTLIGHVYTHRVETKGENGEYEFEYYRADQNIVYGRITHKIDDGAEVLVSKILLDVHDGKTHRKKKIKNKV